MKYISPLPSIFWEQAHKNIAVLGCTGSIGKSTLEVVRAYPEDFTIVALGAGKNIHLLAEQSIEFRPSVLVVQEESSITELRTLLPAGYNPEICYGAEGYACIASAPEVNTVLSAQVGASGLYATYHAVLAGKVVALANKESLVLAGSLLRKIAYDSSATILPVDSEHSAIFQALRTRPESDLRKIILTASGGAFREKTHQELQHVTVAETLKHPTWKMGAKISVDSATMMNKGLEIIEAYHLFGVQMNDIDAIIHPQSIIHSLVEFNDSTYMAQLSYPSMKLAISYALYYPSGRNVNVPSLSLKELATLTFENINESRFPCFRLAKQSLLGKEGSPIVLNGANEIAVEAFLEERISFLDIAYIVEKALENFYFTEYCTTLEEILEVDADIRNYTQNIIQTMRRKRR